MSNNLTKKIIIVLSILTMIFSLFIIGYVFFYSGSNQNNNEEPLSLVEKPFFPEAPTRDIEIERENERSTSTINLTTNPTNGNQSDLGENINPEAVSYNIFKTGTTSEIILIDKNNGNLYRQDDKLNTTRLTNTTFTNIGSGYINKENGIYKVILRFIDKNGSLKTFTGQIKSNEDESIGELIGKNSSNEIYNLTLSPKKDKVLTVEIIKGGIAVYTSNWSLDNKTKIWEHPFSEWQIEWPTDNIISLQTKASGYNTGSLFFLNLKNSSLDRKITNINGLTSLTNPLATKIIYSRSEPNTVGLFLFNVKQETATRLDIKTLPEKCVWFDDKIAYCAVPKTISRGVYPDDWYKGIVSFNDNIWKINTETGNLKLIVENSNNNDLISLSIDPQNEKLYAIDKKTNRLVSFSLEETN